MDDRPAGPDRGDDVGAGPPGVPTARTPGWVKVFWAVAFVLVLLLLIGLVFGGGHHGPGRHV